MSLQHRPIRTRGVLHPTVAMMNEPAGRTVALESHDQGINAQPRLEVIRHGPAHDLARGQVLESGQVENLLVGGDVRDVGQPHGIGALGHKGPTQPVRCNRQVMAAVRGLGLTPPAALGLQTHVAHQPLDPASRVPVPLPAQLSMDPGAP
jgi:hypothetical protein